MNKMIPGIDHINETLSTVVPMLFNNMEIAGFDFSVEDEDDDEDGEDDGEDDENGEDDGDEVDNDDGDNEADEDNENDAGLK